MSDPAMRIKEEAVSFVQGGERVGGFMAWPADLRAPAPAVLVVQEVWGLDEHIRNVTRRAAREGFVALAPDLYSREGPPPGNTIEALRPFMFRIPDLRVVADLAAAMGHLRKSELVRDKPIGAMGFCVGGTWARMLAAEDSGLAACVDFYGRLRYPELSASKPFQPMERVAEMRCPYLGLFGGDDPVIPLADLDELKERLTRAGRAFEIKVYEGAPHAFFNDTRPLYRNPPADDAWRETVRFLRKHLGGGS